MKILSISKNEDNFWIPRPKNSRNTKVYRFSSIISNIIRPYFFAIFNSDKYDVTRVGTSDEFKRIQKNSNLSNSRNNGNFELLFLAKIPHF